MTALIGGMTAMLAGWGAVAELAAGAASICAIAWTALAVRRGAVPRLSVRAGAGAAVAGAVAARANVSRAASAALDGAFAELAAGGRRLLGELLWAALAAGRAVQLPEPRVRTTGAPAATDTRKALQLNALGVTLRRRGDAEQAAQLHRAALRIFQELDDRRAVALTYNNVALALDRAGDDTAAILHFERAADILHDLDDPHHEGQVVANLGAAHVRRGRREEGTELLEAALELLPPGTSARRMVEQHLRRAS